MQNQVHYDIDIALGNLAALMNYDSLFAIPCEPLAKLTVATNSLASDPGLHYLQHAILLQDAKLKVEKNRLLPDMSFSYFNGTNKYHDARNYQGFQVGLEIPLFFSEQRAKVKARRYAWESTVTLQANYIHLYENKVSELMSELEKYRESIQYYEQTGKHLADQLIRSAQENYSAGEIDFFKFAQSMDNAIEIELNYLDNLFQYNTLVLEINYMTL